jgi:hypothetical protein
VIFRRFKTKKLTRRIKIDPKHSLLFVACAIAPDYHKKKAVLWSLVRGVSLKKEHA